MEPGEKSISIATQWGNPDAEARADAYLAALEVCPKHDIHCPHRKGGQCILTCTCPAEGAV